MSSKLDSDTIYEIIKKKIILLEYEPGQVLNEVDLADEYGISRTPIRKVFQMLASDKLLNIVPRFGAQVVAIDFKQMKHIFEITRNLDPFATRLAAERISPSQIHELEEIVKRLNSYDIATDYQAAIKDDERFHQIIFSACGNPWLQDILKTLHYHTERLWHYSEQYFDDICVFTDTLGQILESIKSKNLDDVEKFAALHIDDFVFKIKKEML